MSPRARPPARSVTLLAAAAGAVALLCASVALGQVDTAVIDDAPQPPACEPWPGEPRPLPTADAEDPVLARWASFRAAELAALAEAAEARSRALAYPLWLHARCLDPRRGDVGPALERMRPVRVHRAVPGPALRGLRPAPGFEAAAATLALPVPAPTGPTRVDAARERVEAAERALGSARFEEALESASRARETLAGRGPEALLVRIEIASATAALALGQEGEARASLARALAVSPELELDPARHPPKLRRALEAARAAAGSAP